MVGGVFWAGPTKQMVYEYLRSTDQNSRDFKYISHPHLLRGEMGGTLIIVNWAASPHKLSDIGEMAQDRSMKVEHRYY